MKIHICGIYGSGKSTLAKKLSEMLNTECYSLDDVKYEVKYSKIRPVEERIKKVKEICMKNKWVTEGTWSNYAEDAFKNADLIILMNVPRLVCSYRIIKRHLIRNKHEKDNIIESLKLVKGVFKYYMTKNPVSLYAHKAIINKHRKKYIIIRKNSDILLFIKQIKEKIFNSINIMLILYIFSLLRIHLRPENIAI